LSGGEDNQIEWVNNGQQWRINNSTAGRFYLYDVTNTKFPFGVDANTPSDTLVVKSTGRVGIGTTGPQQALHVSQSGGNNFAGVRAQNSNSGTGTAGIEFSSDATYAKAAIAQIRSDANGKGDLAFYVDSNNDAANWSTGDEKVRIDSSGRVGIGTSSPGYPLDVVGVIRSRAAGGEGGQITLTDVSNVDVFNIDVNDTGTMRLFSVVSNKDIQFGQLVGTGCNINFYTGQLERARIDSSGRLLVGTSTSITTLIAAGLQVQSTGANAYTSIGRWDNNAANPGLIFNKSRGGSVGTFGIVQSGDSLGEVSFTGDDGSAFVYAARIQAQVDGTPGTNDMPGRLVFSTTADGASSPTERMRITNAGDLNYGTGGGIVDPGTGTTDGLYYNNTDKQFVLSRNGGGSLILRRRISDGTIQGFYRDTTLVGTISVTASATAYNTSSDYRLKENVVPLTDAIDRLQQIPVHRFNFIADPDKTVDGFIAHEAQEIVPECVTGTKDEVDDDGNPIYQGIDQSKLVPLLTAALQEAIGRIETLEAEVANLKGV
jgi:hypothetical protein